MLANGFGSVENAGLLGRPPNSLVAGHRGSGEIESKYARAASPLRGIMRKQSVDRDGQRACEASPGVGLLAEWRASGVPIRH